MLREEHMDLFGNLSNGVYTSDVAVTSSKVTSNVIGYGYNGEIDSSIKNPKFNVALWTLGVGCTADFDGTSTKATFVVKVAKELSSGSLSSPVTFFTLEIAKANLKAGKLFEIVLPREYAYVQVECTPDTASSASFTAGKIFGNVVPEFN